MTPIVGPISRPRPRRRQGVGSSGRARLPVLLALSALLTTGCSVSFGDSSDTPSPGASVRPFVQDGRATLDLRTKPTRESLGFQPGKSGAAYDRERGSEGIRVTVTMPSGASTELLAFGLASEALPRYSVPGSDLRNPAPSRTVVNTRQPSAQAAQDALLASADALALDREQLRLQTMSARPGVISGGIVDGLRQDWLSVEVEIRTDEDPGEVVVNYLFSYDAERLPPRASS